MTMQTSKGKTYDVNYAADIINTNRFRAEFADNRLLSEIAPEFEGCEWIKTSDPLTSDFEYEGYTELGAVERSGVNVRILLIKPERGGDA